MPKSDMLIVINSSNRADNVKTTKQLPSNADYIIAVPHNQYQEYIKYHCTSKVFSIPKEVPQYLSSQRQYMVEYAIDEGYKYVFLMDDDLKFLARMREEDKLKLIKCGPADVNNMLSYVRYHLTEVPMVGVSTRLGNNRITAEYDEINRVTRCYAMCLDTFQKVGATFAPFEPFLAQDFHMAICWLNKGYKNRILYTYAQEDSGSNADGGCSTYRTPELLKKVSYWMMDEHDEVTIKGKESKAWKGFDKFRIDMIVQWKKAYKPILKRASGGLNDRLKKKKR